jgi:cysteinyl-tRNA synthetase
MTLKLYNTLTRTKEQFTPLDDKNIRMYVCGPTVYDNAHIGNARPVIVFDVLFRLLRHLYGENHVTYARNITDVDDKINKRAFERWTKKQPLVQEIRALTDSTLKQFHADIDALGVLRPTHEPRATDYIARGDNTLDMVKVISRLIEKGNAYEAEGHVLFSVPSMPNYGELSRRPKDDMIAGARVEVAPYKRDPMDFVLWKPSNPETEPGWESPWGYGRPGWHIECSAMSGALFGDVFDIHGGGLDLIFPHHENEIAQSCCYWDSPKMANIWMHNGFLQVEGEKMSKSTGNFVTINEVLKDWSGEVIRLNMLKTHYRQPIDWTVKGLEECEKMLNRLSEYALGAAYPTFGMRFLNALSDDLNTPMAIAEMHRLTSEAVDGKSWAKNELRGAFELLGFNISLNEKESNVHTKLDDYDLSQIDFKISHRNAARATKNFAESDRLRDELVSMGIEIQDGKDASGVPTTSWKVKE